MTATTTHEIAADGRGGYVAPDVASVDPADEGWEFRCLRNECSFHRGFATLAGARRYITEHMYLNHGVRLFWPETA